jgi:hypothetical protein
MHAVIGPLTEAVLATMTAAERDALVSAVTDEQSAQSVAERCVIFRCYFRMCVDSEWVV